jgi:hypothetical protein
MEECLHVLSETLPAVLGEAFVRLVLVYGVRLVRH